MVLAGGVGERLYPLTKERAKPAVYFGGPYRIIDFTLSNCINSGLRRIFIALQYKSLSLSRHLRMGWSVVADELGEFIEILSPQKRIGEQWYQGTADAVYQNLYSILREDPKHLIVLSGDHAGWKHRKKAEWILLNHDGAWRSWRCSVIAGWVRDFRMVINQEKPRSFIGSVSLSLE